MTDKPPYCNRCGIPHRGECLRKTVAERLDAAQTGKQFAAVLGTLFTALEHAIDLEDAE